MVIFLKPCGAVVPCGKQDIYRFLTGTPQVGMKSEMALLNLQVVGVMLTCSTVRPVSTSILESEMDPPNNGLGHDLQVAVLVFPLI